MLLALATVLVALSFPFVYARFTSGTFLAFTPSKGSIAGLVLLKEVALLVAPAILCLAVLPRETFLSLKVDPGVELAGLSLLFAVSVTVAIVVAALVVRMGGGPHAKGGVSVGATASKEEVLVYVCAAALLLAVLAVATAIGARHALLSVLTGGESLLSVRLSNVNQSGVPSQLVSFSKFLLCVVSVGAGRSLVSRWLGVGLLVSALFAATFWGEKATVLNVAVLALCGGAAGRIVTIGLKSVLVVSMSAVLAAFVVYWLVTLQLPGATNDLLVQYFIDRVVVGQMAGAYEAPFAGVRDAAYALHAVPFASMLLDYPLFDKDLMLVTEGIRDPSATGVKNSLFTAEAFGIGGWPLMLVSPVIVGAMLGISYRAFRKLLVVLPGVGEQVAAVLAPPLFLSQSSLTGGFAPWPLGKTLVLAAIFFLAVWTCVACWCVVRDIVRELVRSESGASAERG